MATIARGRCSAGRARPLAVAIASLAALPALLLAGGAPRALVAAVVAITAALVAGMLVTLAWRISGHAGVVAGAALGGLIFALLR